MFCESYEQELKRSAASGEALSPALERHVSECVSCRNTLAQERELLGGIDVVLHARVNTEIPPSLIPRVREAVSLERRPPRLVSVRALVWPVTACVVALLIVRSHVLAPVRSPLPSTVALSADSTTPAAAVASPDVPRPPRTLHYRDISRGKSDVVEIPSATVRTRTENERSMGALLKLARNQPATVAAFVKSAPTEAPIAIQPIEVADLSWKPVVIVPTEETRSEPNQ